MIFQKIFKLLKLFIKEKKAYKNNQFYKPKVKPDEEKIDEITKLLIKSSKPIFYVGGGVINSGNKASKELFKLIKKNWFPLYSNIDGFGSLSNI